jgi:hypothetical protein
VAGATIQVVAEADLDASRLLVAVIGDRGFAALGAGGGGEKAGGVDDANGGVTAGNSVNGPDDAGIVAGDGRRELRGLTCGESGGLRRYGKCDG